MDKRVIYLGIIIFLALTILSIYILKGSEITGYVISLFAEEEFIDPSLVLALTFDDQDNPWKDYSSYSHIFSAVGGVKWTDKSSCKWHGCANFSDSIGDYLNSTIKFDLNNGMAISFWVYPIEKPADGEPHAYFQIGDADTLKFTEDGGYGISSDWKALNGIVGGAVGESYLTESNRWTHYFLLYNESDYVVWKNGVIILDKRQSYSDLSYSVGEILYIGRGLYDINIRGYLDEFFIYNRSNFTHNDVLKIYNEKRLGTPPTLELYVKNIKYILPRDWDAKSNPLILSTMPITITIANAGTTDSDDFNYKLNLDGNDVCSGRIDIGTQSEINVTCDWVSSYGYHKGFVTIDLNEEAQEDVENNNIQRLYIPFLNRPYFHFDYDEWKNVLKPYCDNPSNIIAYESCDFFKNFVAEDFDDGWTGNDVDPRGKKGRENAMSCMYNDYDMSSVQCQNAKNHLFGWANRSLESYNNVQSIHELLHVGILYDIMFPALSKQDYEFLSKKYHEICQQITNLPNTRPDLDKDEDIIGDNGRGFGSGMAGFCYAIIGEYSENPALIQQLEQQYWGKNIADEWMAREKSYLRTFKNDSWAKYQERWLYKFYSQNHLVENLLFEKRFELNDITNYQNAICSMGRELVTDLLDHTYRGSTLRNDEDRSFRGIQAGDSNSYEDIGSDSLLGWSIADYYAILCNEQSTKSALLYLRELAYNIDESRFSIPEMYIYKQLKSQAVSQSPSSTFPKVIFDNSNDILTIRSNYTYIDDTIIQIDGGEEKGAGHSQAQGYYLYALGEPFLDYEQVPYNDDVRAETWKNGISLQNDTQTQEGQVSFYSQNCGRASLNQYYGMSDCPNPRYPYNYPEHRHFPLEYGGDLEDYIGTIDGGFAGVYSWRPYKNAEHIIEYFVKFGNLLAKRTVVSNNKQGKGLYHNFINIYNEFTETRDGLDITFSRGNKHLDINVIYSNQTLNLGGGQSPIAFCFTKTDCSGSNKGNGKYRRTYLYTEANDIDFILAHHWYSGNRKPITSIDREDKGLRQTGNVIIFDTNNDGVSSYTNKEATGWALAFNEDTKEIAAFNTTSIKSSNIELLSTNSPISAHILRLPDKIVLTVNTMERNNFIDFPKKVRVTIDAQELLNNSGFIITKNDNENIPIVLETGTKVTFDVISNQNSDYYTIVGQSVDSINNTNNPPTIVSFQPSNLNPQYNISIKIDFNLTIFDSENDKITLSWYVNKTLNTTNNNMSYVFNKVGLFNITAIVSDAQAETSLQWLVSIVNETREETVQLIHVNATKYGGSTTDFSNISIGKNLTNVTLEISEYGKIEFDGQISISRSIDIDTYTNISSQRVFVNTTELPEFDVPATITFYNVSYVNPRILKDDTPCPDTICKIINYLNLTFMFNVTGFSEYSVEETPPSNGSEGGGSSNGGGGSDGGDGTGGNADDSASGGGSSSGSARFYICNQEWRCSDWSLCTNKQQKRICEFIRINQYTQDLPCHSLLNSPSTIQSCIVETQKEKQRLGTTNDTAKQLKQDFDKTSEKPKPKSQSKKIHFSGLNIMNIAYKSITPLLIMILIIFSAIPVIYSVRNYSKHKDLTNEEYKLYKYVSKALNKGINEQKIRQVLLNTGWKVKIIDKVVQRAKKNLK